MDILFLQNFQRPILFLFLTSVLILIIVYLFIRPKNQNFLNSNLVRQVYKKNTIWWYIYNLSLFLVTFCSILFVSWLFSTLEKQVVKKEGIDIQIVMDMSYSMIAEDIKPRRIDAAKQMLYDFVSEIHSDRVGMILFSWKPFQSVPLTFDFDFLKEFISNISVDIVNQSTNIELAGTALWDWLILASDILERDYPEREKVIILITDWEANKWVEPELALKLLKEKGIKTYTIWVWKWEETTIRIPVWNYIQEILISWIDEDILKKISLETWGRYFRADSSEAFRDILTTIAQLEKTELEYEIYRSEKSLNIIVLSIILIMLGVLHYIYFYKKIKI